MASILDTIMNAMEKPPTPTEDQRRSAKEATEKIRQLKQKEKDALHNFKGRVQELIRQFITDSNKENIEFEPLDRAYRNIIYDVAEVAGVMACSYGQDEIDRYTVVYRKESGPTEDERIVRNNGGKWNAAVCEEMKKKREADIHLAEEVTKYVKKSVPQKLTGPDYRNKYSHICIELEKTSTNGSYGEVPSSLKRDNRSIEQTLSDLKAKRLKGNTVETSTESKISTSSAIQVAHNNSMLIKSKSSNCTSTTNAKRDKGMLYSSKHTETTENNKSSDECGEQISDNVISSSFR